MKAGNRICRVVAIGIVLGMLSIALPGPARATRSEVSPSPQACYSVDWEVGGTTGGWITFYGVYGENYTLNPDVYSDDLRFVHSDWVMADAWNLVELGWRKAHTWGPRWFAAWMINGYIQYANFDGLAPYTSHSYKIYNYHSDKLWRFVIDGIGKKTVTTNFDVGTPGAMRERHWSCDYGGGHWWNLQRSDWGANFSNWQTWYDHDSDPYYHAYHPTTYEFYVLTGN